ncbi:MAG: hypothetical protein ACLQSR_03880 [Limisphaerales bacterium]
MHRAAGGLTLAVWLLVSAAEVCPPLHAWLHGGSVPDDDDCAVVAIALGHVDVGVADVPPVMPVSWIEIAAPQIEFRVISRDLEHLPPGRAPPAIHPVLNPFVQANCCA